MLIDRLARAFGKPGSGRGLILLYHRVARPARDPFALAVDPDRFGGHLAVLRRISEVLPLCELVDRMIAGKPFPRRAVALTFDDGYADNVNFAEPLLARAQLPATLFIATGYVETGRAYWWDAVESAILGSPLPSRLTLPFPDGPRSWSIVDDPIAQDSWTALAGPALGSRRIALLEIIAAVKPLDLAARERVLEALCRAVGSDLAVEPDARPMKPQDVTDIAGRGTVDIGAHTINHPQLSLLDADRQSYEIAESARAVARWTGRAPGLFAYPFGTRSDYGAESVAAVRRAGFKAACSNFSGLVDRTTSLFELPRLLVRNLPVEEFERLIDAAFALERFEA